MPDPSRATTLTGRLVRLGFTDARRAENLLADKALTALLGDITATHPLLDALALAADQDHALLGIVRLCEAISEQPVATSQRLAATLRHLVEPDTPPVPPANLPVVINQRVRQLIGLVGLSTALTDELIRRPELLEDIVDETPGTALSEAQIRALLLESVDADPATTTPIAGQTCDSAALPEDPTYYIDAMRREYRRLLMKVAATDLAHEQPTDIMPDVAASLADLAAGALEASLAIARFNHPTHGTEVRLSVLGMGKCGGRELNYVSDVDVIYVVEPTDGHTEDQACEVGATLAQDLAVACSGVSTEPALWPVDAALRPEGKNGPLVRTLASHVSYYERWAKTWEFQALLKARHVAGDAELSTAYLDVLNPMVWTAVERDNFVEDAQAMRRRVEEHVPAQEAARQIKLGKGGLRDVEFTMQLLQLVHGRSDDTIHSATTLTALEQLVAGGYIGREHATRLASCYRLLRTMEHRIQMRRMHRSHLIPTQERELEILGRAMNMRRDSAKTVVNAWKNTRRDVRSLHEDMFYRPLLPATARLSADEASLAPKAAQARLRAIGYRHPEGAMRHISALTDGVTRRASIQRHLLPVMLGWFAEGADPDAGLLAFRTLSEELGTTHWYLKMLRDSGQVANRLAYLLSTSRYVSDALSRSPESVAWLDNDTDVTIRSKERLASELDAILTRADDAATATTLIRAIRRRELARTATAKLLGLTEPRAVAHGITDAADVTMDGALRIARHVVTQAMSLDTVPAQFAIIAMGRMGGREMGYGSDADVMFVYHPINGAQEQVANQYALQLATAVKKILTDANPEPSLDVDADLRPEGRSGPLVRSLDAYREYYERWFQPWEQQALLRARAVAGDNELREQFTELIDPLRYPQGGIPSSTVREIRRIKARVEAERLPRGVHPNHHLKLGRGAISDVEWLVQLIQLEHGHRVSGLRTTETLRALQAATDAGIVSPEDATFLRHAWQLASDLRDANVLWSGRTTGAHVDVLPQDRVSLGGVGRVLGYTSDSAHLVEEDYLRAARRARNVMERLFYGIDE
ncbi:bifunctional [glutamine synthetase] adenylyltransferase/[glutamine synthetase]-adenylyl-L-tyrosine phosphorylase [Jonesia quinghaiensis]|uniref:bifunctional [glutamine synthetase] adenylyltransferase/[glutamine synthetase]-adenylyl-L-tyrosine phosphorylase n=1 Tax=Jonesia quinghaiensis TaxID=262806 RepID=UPI000491299A|nr:bifunctional [glutamine synthetase] adenylyltransferase/[glutamine synthetase]-adenylyl-L-tyrosine phosphorylase [Jonesia quinghaiensis]